VRRLLAKLILVFESSFSPVLVWNGWNDPGDSRIGNLPLFQHKDSSFASIYRSWGAKRKDLKGFGSGLGFLQLADPFAECQCLDSSHLAECT
jgi:hypothetical protein